MYFYILTNNFTCMYYHIISRAQEAPQSFKSRFTSCSSYPSMGTRSVSSNNFYTRELFHNSCSRRTFFRVPKAYALSTIPAKLQLMSGLMNLWPCSVNVGTNFCRPRICLVQPAGCRHITGGLRVGVL